MYKHEIGAEGLVMAAILAGLMMAGALLFAELPVVETPLGVCLPSPNQWHLDRWVSWGINLTLTVGIACALYLINKHFNFIRTTDTVLPAAFLVLMAAVPQVSMRLDAGVLVSFVWAGLLPLLFAVYRRPNATQQMFVAATFISLGSMICYAFALYAVGLLILGAMMKALRIKEFIATLLGLAAPYWVGIGFALISPSWFHMPEPTNFIMNFRPDVESVLLASTVGLTLLWVVPLSLRNSIRLYAGNSRILAMNFSFTVLGIISILGMLIDYGNIATYIPTLFMSAAVTLAESMALWPPRKPSIPLSLLVAFYLGLSVALIYFLY